MNTEYDSIEDIINDVNDAIENYIDKNMVRVQAGDAGLDSRCGYLFLNRDCLIVNVNNDPTLKYYGGFEYIESWSRSEVGNYVIYNAADNRVWDCVNYYYAEDAEDEESA